MSDTPKFQTMKVRDAIVRTESDLKSFEKRLTHIAPGVDIEDLDVTLINITGASRGITAYRFRYELATGLHYNFTICQKHKIQQSILNKLEEYWAENPQLRFAQIVMNVFVSIGKADGFHCTDEEFEKGLDVYLTKQAEK